MHFIDEMNTFLNINCNVTKRDMDDGTNVRKYAMVAAILPESMQQQAVAMEEKGKQDLIDNLKAGSDLRRREQVVG